MGNKACKSKRVFFSEEEAFHLGMPGLKSYFCPHCKNWHQTSKQKIKKWKKKK